MADDEQFSLCWNNFNSNLSAGFHESLCRGDLVDVTLAAEGQFVKAHRLVLSVCSPYFRKMFTQMPANQHAFVFLKDVSHTALKDLIQFMYCGEVNVKQEALPAFISTAEALQIKGLTDSDPPASQSPPQPSTPQQIRQISPPRGRTRTSTGTRSYKIETVDDSGDDKPQTTQIVIQTSAAPQGATIAQQSQHLQQTQQPQIVTQQITSSAASTTAGATTVVSHKRPARSGGSVQHSKRTKSTMDPLDSANVPSSTAANTQQITVQTAVVAAPTIKPQPNETEYIDLPIELPTKSEPDYAEEAGDVEASEQDATYVEDDSYGDMRYDDSYFTENEDGGGNATAGSATSASGGGGGTGTATTSKAIVKQSGSFSESSFVEGGDGGNNEAQESRTKASPKAETLRVQYRTSLKGTEQLVLNGFPYTRHRIRGETTYWRCVQFRPLNCKARVQMRSTGISLGGEKHNHAVLKERRKKGSLKRVYEEHSQSVFTYNYRGLLVYKDYAFSAHTRNHKSCSVWWRCSSYAKTRCPMTIVTKAKAFHAIRGDQRRLSYPVQLLHPGSSKLRGQRLMTTQNPKIDAKLMNPAKMLLKSCEHIKGGVVRVSSNGHNLTIIKKARLSGRCVQCIKKGGARPQDLTKIFTYCPECPGSVWICEKCFIDVHPIAD